MEGLIMEKKPEWERMAQRNYLMQQGISDYSEQSIAENGLQGDLTLLKETENTWIVLHTCGGQWLDVIWKYNPKQPDNFYRMETIELY